METFQAALARPTDTENNFLRSIPFSNESVFRNQMNEALEVVFFGVPRGVGRCPKVWLEALRKTSNKERRMT